MQWFPGIPLSKYTGIIPVMGSANERRRKNITSFFIGPYQERSLIHCSLRMHQWTNYLVAQWNCFMETHYNDAIMGAIASQIIRLTIVYSIVYSDADQRKHQSSAWLAFMWGIHRWIPHINGQLREKCFHLMTSSCVHSHQTHKLGHFVGTVLQSMFLLVADHLSFNTMMPRQMHAISQTTSSSAFPLMKMFEFRFKCQWNLFLRVQLTIFKHWFR